MDTIVSHLNSVGESFIDFVLPMLIQSSILIVILLGLDFVLRKKVRAVFRYCIWMLVLVKLVLPTSLASPSGIMYWLSLDLPELTNEEPVIAGQPQIIPQPIVPMDQGPSNKAIATAPSYVDTVPRAASIEPEPVQSVTTAVPATGANPITWQAVVFIVWLSVLITMVLLLLQRLFFVRGLIGQSQDAGDTMADTLGQCCQQMSIKRKISLKLSSNTASPSVCGLFRPVILIPAELPSKLDCDHLKAVLLHELAHIKRSDLWVSFIQTILQIIYFYNPLLWLANSIIRQVREQAVDEMVQVAMGEKAENYPQMLVNVFRLSFSRPALGLRLIGVVESKSSLRRRVKHILNRPIPKTAKLGIMGLLAIIITAAVLLPMATANPGPPGLVIKGVVTDAQSGQPIAGATVKAIVEAVEAVEAAFTGPEPGSYSATLPNGVTVELIGICEHPTSEGKQWWRPDGSLLKQQPYDSSPATLLNSTYKYEFVYRLSGSPGLLTTLGTNKDFGMGMGPRCLSDTSEKIYLPDKNSLYSYVRESMKALKQGDITILVGNESDWATVTAMESPHELGSVHTFDAIITSPLERNGITYVDVVAPKVTNQARVIAVDKQGHKHIGRGYSSGSTFGSTKVFATGVEFPLPLSDIQSIEYQTQDFVSVTFKNVSLQGGHKTAVEIEIKDQAQTGNVPAGMVGTWQADILWSSEQFAVFPDSRIVIVSKDGEKQQTKYIDGYIEYEDQKAKLFLTDDGYLILYLISQDQEDLAGRFRKISDQPQTVWQDDISYDANSPESKQVYIPDADTENTNVVLDLTTGEMLPAGQEESQLVGTFDKMGKGDLAYDGVLICLRNGKVDLWDGKVVTPLLVEDQIQDAKAYKLKSIPSRLLVTTAEDKKFDVTVLSLKESGINIEYRTIISSTLGKENNRLHTKPAVQVELKEKETEGRVVKAP